MEKVSAFDQQLSQIEQELSEVLTTLPSNAPKTARESRKRLAPVRRLSMTDPDLGADQQREDKSRQPLLAQFESLKEAVQAAIGVHS